MKLAIIVGATREGRQSDKVAKWVELSAKESGILAEVIDLRDYPMPFFNESVSPRYNPNRTIDQSVQLWLDKIKDFDAYIFVTPEYNHSIPGVLKNAIDYITSELNRKPSAVVSHGSVGGVRAATDLKEILSESQSVVIPKTATLMSVSMTNAVDNDGHLSAELLSNPYGPKTHIDNLLKELEWYSDALSAARNS